MSKNIENRSKKLEDYLHLYLGCDVQADGNLVGKLLGYSARGFKEDDVMVFYTVQMSDDEDYWTVFNDDRSMDRIKPILRPLSDMTQEEAIETTKPVVIYGNVRKYEVYENSFGKKVVSWGESMREKYVPQDETCYVPRQFVFLLSKHFDLFGLIEAGIAIDKTKIQQTTSQ
jgi:hypothetical protein